MLLHGSMTPPDDRQGSVEGTEEKSLAGGNFPPSCAWEVGIPEQFQPFPLGRAQQVLTLKVSSWTQPSFVMVTRVKPSGGLVEAAQPLHRAARLH